jgi:hypothetical protein
MIRLPDALRAWNTPEFAAILKRELEQLGGAALPLQQALAAGSVALDEHLSVMFIGATADPHTVHARVGVFYGGLIAGCSCADDPTPVEAQNEYCELALSIDKTTAVTQIAVTA